MPVVAEAQWLVKGHSYCATVHADTLPLHGARAGSVCKKSEHRCPLTCWEEQLGSFFLVWFQRAGGRQVKEQIFGILEWSTVCFYQGHPESMKWNLRMQNKSQISLPVTVKTPFSHIFLFFSFKCISLVFFFFSSCFHFESGKTCTVHSPRVCSVTFSPAMMVVHRLMVTHCLMVHIGLQQKYCWMIWGLQICWHYLFCLL